MKPIVRIDCGDEPFDWSGWQLAFWCAVALAILVAAVFE